MSEEQQNPFETPQNEISTPNSDFERNPDQEPHELVTHVAVAVRDNVVGKLQNSGEYTPEYLPPVELVPEKKLIELKEALKTLSSANVVQADNMIAFLNAMKTARGIVGMIRGRLKNQQKHTTQKTRSGKFKTVSTEAGESSEETETPLSLVISEAVRALESNPYLGMYISTIDGKTSLQIGKDIPPEVIQVLRKVGQDLGLELQSGVAIEIAENFLVQYPHVAEKIKSDTYDVAKSVVEERAMKESWLKYVQQRYENAQKEIRKRGLKGTDFDLAYQTEFTQIRSETDEQERELSPELLQNLGFPVVISSDDVGEEYHKRLKEVFNDFQKERAVFSLVDSDRHTLINRAYTSFLPPEASPDGSKPTKKNFKPFATDFTKEMIRQEARPGSISMVFEDTQFKGEKVYIVCPDVTDLFKKGEAEFAFALNTLIHRTINSSPLGSQNAGSLSTFAFKFFRMGEDFSDLGIAHPEEVFQINLKNSAVGLEANFEPLARYDYWTREKFEAAKQSLFGTQK